MNFVAIDFETATAQRDSACSVGLVVVREARIANRFSSLIRPRNLDFCPRNMSIHGITPDDVKNQPSFEELWPQLGKLLGNDVLVAHNASFDMSVLHGSLTSANITWPQFNCVCTVEMSRHLLPGLKDHKLSTLAALFGIQLEHHKACADAAVCAQLAMLLSRIADPCGITHFARAFSYGCVAPEHSGGIGGPISSLVGQPANSALVDSPYLDNEPRVTNPPVASFVGLHFVFTGDMSAMSRHDAESMVVLRGGEVGSSVSKKTDYVVVGNCVLSAFQRTGHATTQKLLKAAELSAQGKPVKIIGEAEFIRMTEVRAGLN